MRVAVAIEIPRRIDEGVHGVAFAPCRSATFRTVHVDERRNAFERRTAFTGDLYVERKKHRQIFFGHGHDAALGAMHHGNGRAPIALARNAPILYPISDGLVAEAFGLARRQPFSCGRRRWRGQTIRRNFRQCRIRRTAPSWWRHRPSVPSTGRITGVTGIPYSRQNSKSRSSCAGTAIIAPVP